MEILNLILSNLFYVILIILYFLPTLIAENRKHNNENPIFVINIFFGWTIIGWIICLAWAFTNNSKKKK